MRPYAQRKHHWRHKVRQRVLDALRRGKQPYRPDKASIHSKGAWARGEGGRDNSGKMKR